MDRLQQTICALATPPGTGGIAVVRVSGPDAYPMVEKIFVPLHVGRKVAEAKGYTAMLGHYLLHGQEMDETIALFFRAPHSYTGEDVIELSVHGGTAMADGLLEALITAGTAPAGPGEFTRRALEHGRMSLTQAEAVMEVIAANGRQGAALAKSALDGRLAKRIGAIQTVLQSLNAHLTAWIDYPEEDVPELSDEHLLKTLGGQKAELDSLIRGYGAGAVLRRGVDCVLLGRPNVGKSTLLNLMAGFDRAIVTPVAGTTRDIVEQAVQLGEIRLNLFDTAGVRDVGADGDAIEAEGIRRSWKKLDEAGLVLAVFDAAQSLTDADLEIAHRCQNRPALGHFFAVQLVEQKIERDLIFRGEAVSMKGCERCFHTLQQGIIRGAVRDGNRAERGGAGGNSAGSRIGEGIVERDGRRGYLGVEPFLHIRGKPAVLTRGKERGKIPEQQGEKKSAAQKQREQDAAVQRSWFHRIGSGADSYHKVCKKC